MNLDEKLRVCETMLGRLDAAMTTAEAEAKKSSALEDHLRRLLDDLEEEEVRLDRTIRAAIVQEESPNPAQGSDDAAMSYLHEQMTRIRTVQIKLQLLLKPPKDAAAQRPLVDQRR